METALIVLSVGGLGFLVFLAFWIFQSFQLLQNHLLQLSRQMNDYLTGNNSVIQNYIRQMGEIQHELGQLRESTQSMIRIGTDISSLQDILKAPKPRGVLGELLLESLLGQLLPQDRYIPQYKFRNGEKVDAVILLGQGMVPVDSKFPLENFKRLIQTSSEEEAKKNRKQFYQDVKKHVDQIASKYILPEEGTFDFALMYIPAENVYYETIVKDDERLEAQSLAQYAISRKVIPVSPNSFYAYLQAIVLGLRGLRIENSAREILNGLAQLANNFSKFYDDFEKLGGHLANAKNAHEKAQKYLDKCKYQLNSIESQELTTPAIPGSPPTAVP